MKKKSKKYIPLLIGALVILIGAIFVGLFYSFEHSEQTSSESSAFNTESTTLSASEQETTSETPAATESQEQTTELSTETTTTESATLESTTPESAATETESDKNTDDSMTLDKGIVINNISSYTGIYMEDGTDEMVSRILMINVTNTGDRTIQYAEIQLTDGTDTAKFTLSTLPPGESMTVLEQNRMPYADGVKLTQASAVNVALFPEEPSIHEDKLKIQILDGIMNLTNISGAPINGNIVVYYKNFFNDSLYGGITYRVTISGGLKNGEIKQISANHFSSSDSRLMFITIE